MEFRASFAGKKSVLKFDYYFGEPIYSGRGTGGEHWGPAAPGDISFNGSTIVFNGTVFRRRSLDIDKITLKLDLKKIIKKIKKKASMGKNMKWIGLRFEPHGVFLNRGYKELFFCIRASEKSGILYIYDQIMVAKDSDYGDPESGSITKEE